MEDEQWKEFVDALVDAKRSLSNAWAILDGTDGAATGSEPALTAALAGIDALFGIESSHEANMDVATPAEVQEFLGRAFRVSPSEPRSQSQAPAQDRSVANANRGRVRGVMEPQARLRSCA
jgi:hypothetical protein